MFVRKIITESQQLKLECSQRPKLIVLSHTTNKNVQLEGISLKDPQSSMTKSGNEGCKEAWPTPWGFLASFPKVTFEKLLAPGLKVQLPSEALSVFQTQSLSEGPGKCFNMFSQSSPRVSENSRTPETSLTTKKKTEWSGPRLRGWCHLSPHRKGHASLCGSPWWHHLLLTGHLALPLLVP